MSSREFLNTLRKEVVVDCNINLSQDTELSDRELRLKNVSCLPLDLENPATFLDTSLPFLFNPLPSAVLRDHPLSETSLSGMKFYDFGNPPEAHGEELFPWTLAMRVQAVCNYVARWTLGCRPSLPSRLSTLSSFSRLDPIQ